MDGMSCPRDLPLSWVGLVADVLSASLVSVGYRGCSPVLLVGLDTGGFVCSWRGEETPPARKPLGPVQLDLCVSSDSWSVCLSGCSILVCIPFPRIFGVSPSGKDAGGVEFGSGVS